jgi:hypothetical protein
MTEAKEEGADFVGAMRKHLAQDPQSISTKERLKAERRAGRTPKQRVKRAKKPHALNFRASDETFALVVALMGKLGADKTTVLEHAIAALAKQEGVKVGG